MKILFEDEWFQLTIKGIYNEKFTVWSPFSLTDMIIFILSARYLPTRNAMIIKRTQLTDFIMFPRLTPEFYTLKSLSKCQFEFIYKEC